MCGNIGVEPIHDSDTADSRIEEMRYSHELRTVHK